MNSIYKFISILMVCGLLIASQANAQAKKEPNLLIATTMAYAPFANLDTQGFVHGFSVSFTQALCKEMKMRCVYQPMDFPEMFQAVAENKVDAAIGAISITPGREKDYAFTVPFLTTQINFVAAMVNGKRLITSITPESLKGKIIAVQVDSVFPDYVLKDLLAVNIKFYDGERAILEALIEHKVNLALINTASANFWANQAQDHIYIVGKPINPNLGIGMMLNKDKPELLKKLNAAILKFTATEEFKEMLNTFFVPIGNRGVTQN